MPAAPSAPQECIKPGSVIEHRSMHSRSSHNPEGESHRCSLSTAHGPDAHEEPPRVVSVVIALIRMIRAGLFGPGYADMSGAVISGGGSESVARK